MYYPHTINVSYTRMYIVYSTDKHFHPTTLIRASNTWNYVSDIHRVLHPRGYERVHDHVIDSCNAKSIVEIDSTVWWYVTILSVFKSNMIIKNASRLERYVISIKGY